MQLVAGVIDPGYNCSKGANKLTKLNPMKRAIKIETTAPSFFTYLYGYATRCGQVTLLLTCFALSPKAQAVSPPPDGGYAGGNTAEGSSTLLSRSTGLYNTAIGIYSLLSLTDGNFCTGVGAGTLLVNTADQNTATGAGALLSNTTGGGNTANGAFALFNNTEGDVNTANGYQALFSNTAGDTNTAIGAAALFSNTIGNDNTANGWGALLSNTTGDDNTAIGRSALGNMTHTGSNTAVGSHALANSTGGGLNTAIGANAGSNVTTASNVICIGAGVAGANVFNRCYIGEIYTNVQPVVGTDPDYVTINSSGRLGRANVSSRRYKHDIKAMDKASEVLFALKPVSFRYNKDYDATQTLAFGLIAEEVAEVDANLVGRNPEGQPESVRYEQINAMLLNEFLKEHSKVETLEAALDTVNKRLNEQEARIQKVSAELEVSKPATNMVLNNQ
jgi:endosialidase-like protein